ncbi:MAG: hypothetical protein WDO70_06255 [Alphaproteobacteria bacterium]
MTVKTEPAAESQDIQLIKLMNELADVMEREIAAVEEHLNEHLPALVARKQRLLVDYQAEFKVATEHPEWLKQLPQTQKSLLRSASTKLNEVAERNVRIVKVAMTATQRLLQGIMASVRDEKLGQRGYQHLVQPNSNTPIQSALFKTTA